MAINTKYDLVTLIRAGGGEVVCRGISIPGEGGKERGYLSMQGRDFATKFDIMGNGTSYGQLIARSKAKPIFKLGEGAAARYYELPEDRFEVDHDPNRKISQYRVKLHNKSEEFVVANVDSWIQCGGSA